MASTPPQGPAPTGDPADVEKEAARVAELHDLNILDTPPEQGFDDLAQVAAQCCEAPVALVSFVDEDRQWFKAEIGMGCRETPLDLSVCRFALEEEVLLVIPDLTIDPRTASNALVTGPPRFRFYAGAVIRSAAGTPLGSLCVLDHTRRLDGLTEGQARSMTALARQISTLIDHRQSLTQIAAREAELAANERRFRVMTSAMPQMVWTTLPDGFHDYYNDRWYEFTGVPYGSTDGEGWNGMFHPEDQDRAWARWRHSLATGDPYEIEYRLRHRSGAYRWTLGRAMPIRDADGRIERWFGTCTDIEDIKRLEDSRDLLIRELSHRIKNIFAVVGGIAALSSRGDSAARPFVDAFRERLGALAQAHEYVRPHSPDSAPPAAGQTVLGLMRLLMAAYTEAGRERIVITGEDTQVGERAATALALIMHEQATNAIKYGGLSTEGGTVSLSGHVVGDAYHLSWVEAGGPVIAATPSRRGFGTVLAERSIAGQLDGVLEHDWAPDGLAMRLSVPLENLRF